jgi:hypothetical protein
LLTGQTGISEILVTGAPRFNKYSVIKRSREISLLDFLIIKSPKFLKNLAEIDFSFNKPDAIASSGCKSITQKQNGAFFILANQRPINAENGGTVVPITRSTDRLILNKLKKIARLKVKKFKALKKKIVFVIICVKYSIYINIFFLSFLMI